MCPQYQNLNGEWSVQNAIGTCPIGRYRDGHQRAIIRERERNWLTFVFLVGLILLFVMYPMVVHIWNGKLLEGV